MPRLAWFTPWPPQRSGVAGRSAEVVPLLAGRGLGIDVFVDERAVPMTGRAPDAPPAPGEVRVQTAHDFPWRHARGQYDLVVYQLGNSSVHDFTWPYLFRWPGLVVLHDTSLHHARAQALLSRRRLDAYRAEFAWNHPGVRPAAAGLAVRGFSGVYYYCWPMSRAVIESARLVGVHSRGGCRKLQDAFPDRPITYIALGEGVEPAPGVQARFRAAHDLPEGAVLFGVFGMLTEEKRIGPILRAFTAARARNLNVHLVLAGWPDPRLGIPELIESHGLTGSVSIIARLDDAEFDAAIAAMDVCLCLRWPTAGETSGPWLRALASARPTIISDLVHLSHVPTLDPRTWRRHAPSSDTSLEADDRSAAIGIDLLDEDHSLRLAIVRLATDPALREQLGRAGRAYWEQEHTVTHMVEDYLRAIAQAVTLPMPEAPLPRHLHPDPAAQARGILAPFGLPAPF
jgi:glycosyltransferase involved in cell wall biosynthesis